MVFFVILVDDVYCVAIHDLSPVLTALFSIELGGFNNKIMKKANDWEYLCVEISHQKHNAKKIYNFQYI